ncbi:alpha/beta hydrolase [Kribbella sp. NBC_01505]|uniref:alpha/beta fold hydrolase n=1 Tax=Kribbella sp. NBC_01505 TaxID=2903580 RepID=UPI0038645E53
MTNRIRFIAAAVIATLALSTGCATSTTTTPTPSTAATYTAATRDDADFNHQFRHEFAEVDGVRMHYVTGGTGSPLILLHGWPQSWYEWRGIMPALAKNHTVYAIDLPGLGDSEGTPSSYSKATLARYLHGLISDKLDLKSIGLVGHDLGAGVGFQYAAQYPTEVTRYAHLDYPLPGPVLSAGQYRTLSWHLAFHTQADFPEAVVANDVRRYLGLFIPTVAYGGKSFGGTNTKSPYTDREIDEFARTYSRPQVLTGGFNLYRTLDQDERDNRAAKPITTPTLLLTAQGLLPFTRSTLQPRVKNLIKTAEVPHAGHWLPEENPAFVTTQLLSFFNR